ncbi:MAG: polysaccharide deacetylase family protein [Pseudomonadota bacterium]
MKTARGNKPDLLFLLSVDTEEEWDWSGSFPEPEFSISNTARIADFQDYCESRGIRPTYFVDYAVADDASSSATLRQIAASQRAEIGAHLHPWANPPYYGPTGEYESHVVNLPLAQTEAKLDALLRVISQRIGVAPNSFRSGRWGIDRKIFDLLRRRGIRIDSSMYPCFKNDYFDCEHTPLHPYWPDFDAPSLDSAQRDILEIPPTVGFNWRNQRSALGFYKFVTRPAFEPFRLVGVLWHSKILRKLYLSPEVISGTEMADLIDIVIAKRLPMLHMYLHSSSFIDYSRGMMSRADAFETLTRNIDTFLRHAQERANLRFCTISEAATLHGARWSLAA